MTALSGVRSSWLTRAMRSAQLRRLAGRWRRVRGVWRPDGAVEPARARSRRLRRLRARAGRDRRAQLAVTRRGDGASEVGAHAPKTASAAPVVNRMAAVRLVGSSGARKPRTARRTGRGRCSGACAAALRRRMATAIFRRASACAAAQLCEDRPRAQAGGRCPRHPSPPNCRLNDLADPARIRHPESHVSTSHHRESAVEGE